MVKRVVIFALLCVSFAFAKTYAFSVVDPTKAGEVQLTAGEYKLKVDGGQAVITDSAGRQIEVKGRIEEADRRFPYTMVSVSKADGDNRILKIELGGTRTRVVFE